MDHPSDDTRRSTGTADGDQPAPRKLHTRGFDEVLALVLTRRAALAAGAGLLAAHEAGAPRQPPAAAGPASPLGFVSVPAAGADRVVVPPGYRARVLYAWGDPIGASGLPAGEPAWRGDASEDAAAQALQAGMHHDGMHFFPLPARGADRGLLALNHEYVDHGLLFPDGSAGWSAAKVRKSQAAHGVSVIELGRGADGAWQVVRPSRHARRITANTPMRLSGPAAQALGGTATGTFANCANGWTPWGTYLTCEENWHGYFGARKRGELPEHDTAFQPDELERRYGIRARGDYIDWHLHDPRFDLHTRRDEPLRFGWVVEIDPFDPASQPVKHTAMGRFKHEGAAPARAADGRMVFYMGDDQAGEYVYKFVTRARLRPGRDAANRRLLEEGTLYVARFDAAPASGRRLATGRWLPLTREDPRLAARFASQAELLIATRIAADIVGATRMDRPEWIAVHPRRAGEVYCSLTNNSTRGAQGGAPVNDANPRAANVYGHVIRWHETGGDAAAETFEWDIFVMGGDPAQGDAGRFEGDFFGSPDGLAFDPAGRLWIQTDISSDKLGKGAYQRMTHNMALAADTRTGELRRFLTGPPGCEITGLCFTPDGRTLFVNIQHPGETPGYLSAPGPDGRPNALSTWPSGQGHGPADNGSTPPQRLRPRSATVVVTREDGGVIGDG